MARIAEHAADGRVSDRSRTVHEDGEPSARRRGDSGAVGGVTSGGGGGGGPLERVTVNLTPRASRALESVTVLTGDSKTDTINRALQIYAFLEETVAKGGTVVVQEGKDAPPQLIRFF